MNVIDIVLAALCVVFAVAGIVKGLVRQLFSIGSLVLGHLAGIRLYALAGSTLGLSARYRDIAGYLAVFLAVYLVCRVLGSFIEGRIRASSLSGTDRLAGMVAGLAKGALVSVLLVFVLVVLMPDSRALRQSKAVPYAIAAGHWLAKAFPDRIAAPFREQAKAIEKLHGGVFPFRD